MKSLNFFFFFIFVGTLSAQSDWELKKDKNDIQVYYRDAADSYVKELKIKTIIDAPLSTIMALLYDVELYPEWVYSCSTANLEKQVTDSEVYYYSVMDFPWPLWDRDFIAHGKIHQDPVTGKITTSSVAKPAFLPEKKGIVRIKEMNIRWELTPQKDGTVLVEYYLKSHPGGNLPAWAINMALDKGPVQSITGLKRMINEDKYQLAKMNFIDDFNTK